MHHRRFALLLTFLCLLAALPALAASAATDQLTLDEAIHDLSIQQSNAHDYVQLASQIQDPAKRLQAWKLYSQARAQYNAFIDDIGVGLEYPNRKVNPLRHAQDAYNASHAFSTFVDQNGPTKMGFMSALLPIVENLLKQVAAIEFGAKGVTVSSKNDLATQVRGYKWDPWSLAETPSTPDHTPDTPATKPPTSNNSSGHPS